MALLVKKSGFIVFILGLGVLAILSVVGLIYLSQMSYANNIGKCANLSDDQVNISRISIVALWALLGWIAMGSVAQIMWKQFF